MKTKRIRLLDLHEGEIFTMRSNLKYFWGVLKLIEIKQNRFDTKWTFLKENGARGVLFTGKHTKTEVFLLIKA